MMMISSRSGAMDNLWGLRKKCKYCNNGMQAFSILPSNKPIFTMPLKVEESGLPTLKLRDNSKYQRC